MQRTLPLQKLITTNGGMRRMLKNLPPVSKYIRLAVDSGIYRDMDNEGNPHYLLTRQSRNDGREIEDYPVEYQIMTLYPPYPDPPHIPEAYRRKMERTQKPHETQTLMAKRLKIFKVVLDVPTNTRVHNHEHIVLA